MSFYAHNFTIKSPRYRMTNFDYHKYFIIQLFCYIYFSCMRLKQSLNSLDTSSINTASNQSHRAKYVQDILS